MQGFTNLWLLRFACYVGVLVISLGVQAVRPDLFETFCHPQPIAEFLNQASHLAVPLNSQLFPQGETDK
jgi:hypothetical protein